MSGTSLIIDYIDLTLRIPLNCEQEIRNAVELFEEHSTYVEIVPKIKKNSLHINSNDMVQLLGYIDPIILSEFDRAKLKQIILQELDQQLLRSTSLEKQAHYKWCMTAVKNFELGRHLKDLEVE